MESVGSPTLWAGFSVFVFAMLALDLGVFHRKSHEIKFKEALIWTFVWIGLSLLINLVIWRMFGPQKGLEFLTGYLIEKALSVDNIFVFIVIFSTFAVPKSYQHRVLFWGIFGALILRAIFIFVGAAMIQRFHWIMYVFGALLVWTAFKLMLERDEEMHPEQNPIYRWVRKVIPSVPDYHGQKFFVKIDGKRFVTPLFLVLIAVEISDLIFAVDSIPAIFAVTTDPFIVYTSNVCAILGLRAMYFVLAGVMDKFAYLRIGLALILGFVGVKMLIVDFYKIPIVASLLIIAGILALSIIASILRPAEEIVDPIHAHDDDQEKKD